MSRSASVVEINGRSYDAVTGDAMGTVEKITHRLTSSDGVIDGFVKRKTANKPKPTKKAESSIKKIPSRHRVIKSGARSVHHRTQRSHTLMRNAVKRPGMKIVDAARTISRAPARSEDQPTGDQRATLIAKHEKVSRFGQPRSDSAETHQVTVSPRTLTSQSAETAPSHLVASPSYNVSHAKLERLLDQALLNANSHRQAGRASRRWSRFIILPRWLSWTIIFLALLTAALFFVWRDVPAVAIKVASSRANVNATMPAYTPAGFSYAGPIGYSAGTVVIKFNDKNTAGQGYSLVQKKSSRTGLSLSNDVLADGAQFQTSQVAGTTVYIYGASNNATWVSNGILYTIENRAALTTDQLLRIVQSM